MITFPQNKKILIGLGVLIIVVGMAVYFLHLSRTKKAIPEGMSQVVSTQNLGNNVVFEEKISIEKTEDSKYQPILTMKLTKPKGQEFKPSLIIYQKIPKQFSQNADELSFNIPPRKILEKDPLVVWSFDHIAGVYCFMDIAYEVPNNSTGLRNNLLNPLAMIVWPTPEENEQPQEEENQLGDGCYDLKAMDADYRQSFVNEVLIPRFAELEKLSREEHTQKLNELVTQYQDEQKQKSADEKRKKIEDIMNEQREYDQKLGEFKNQILDWLSGRLEELVITIKQKVMGQDEAVKVFTETVTQMTGKAPLIEITPTQKVEKTQKETEEIVEEEEARKEEKKEKEVKITQIGPGKIAFVRQNEKWSQDTGDIWVMDPDGSNQKQLTFDGAAADNRNPSWSPDAKKIVFVKNKNEIWTINADGSGAQKPPLDYKGELGGGAEVFFPTWSPTGETIAFHLRTKINRIFIVRVAPGLSHVGTKQYEAKYLKEAPYFNLNPGGIFSLQYIPDEKTEAGMRLFYTGNCRDKVGNPAELCAITVESFAENISHSCGQEEYAALSPLIPDPQGGNSGCNDCFCFGWIIL